MPSNVSSSNIQLALAKLESSQSEFEIVWSTQDWKKRLPSLKAISVLDASFNPPTLAHLALARLALHDPSLVGEAEAGPSALGHLVLLSATNVDKKLKDGDASYAQRLEMMVLLAQELAHPTATDDSDPSDPLSSSDLLIAPAVAVAIIDEPTFKGKSSKLRDFFDRQLNRSDFNNHVAPPELSFVIGYDTLIRLFDLKYYGNSYDDLHGALDKFFRHDGSSVVCVRRNVEGRDEAAAVREEAAFLDLPHVKPYLTLEGRVKLVNISEDEASMSSTLVREGVAKDDRLRGSIGKESAWRSMTLPSIAAFIEASQLYTAR